MQRARDRKASAQVSALAVLYIAISTSPLLLIKSATPRKVTAVKGSRPSMYVATAERQTRQNGGRGLTGLRPCAMLVACAGLRRRRSARNRPNFQFAVYLLFSGW